MRLIHQFVGFITGILMGALALVAAVALFCAYFLSQDYKEESRAKKKPKYTGNRDTERALDWGYSTRAEAAATLEVLQQQSEGKVTLAQLKELLHLIPTFGDDLRGWTSLHGAIILYREEDELFHISFPDMKELTSNGFSG